MIRWWVMIYILLLAGSSHLSGLQPQSWINPIYPMTDLVSGFTKSERTKNPRLSKSFLDVHSVKMLMTYVSVKYHEQA